MADRVLNGVLSLRERLNDALAIQGNEFALLLKRLKSNEKQILKPDELKTEFETICKDDQNKLHDAFLNEVIKSTQEAIVMPPWVALAVRLRPGVWEYVRINVDSLLVEHLTVPRYLHFKEQLRQ